ncbi:DNA cytosine methyltransferase [Micromonospora musae]|uniref:DNA cytosine methyltransferase n=1 Tax=Micromonospora musae TaxID=1894970 RepID=UPI0033DCC587
MTTNPPPRIGSLCTGYGGLDLAVELVLGGRLSWYAEVDRHACTVLARHWPGVPNLGDIRAVDWTRAAPVDIVTAGCPCQDISSVEAGVLRSTLTRQLGPINAENLRRAHELVETAATIGKVVVAGF